MSNKKMTRDEQIEVIQDSMDKARELKLALNKNRQKVNKNDEETKMKFQEFWAKNKTQYSCPKDIEHILWVHLKAAGYDSPEKFEAGIKNFGFDKI